MRVMITGVTGFLGSHLANRLTANGHDVIGITRHRPRHWHHPRHHPRHWHRHRPRSANVLDHVELVQTSAVEETLATGSPVDAIIHTATNYGGSATPLHQLVLANVHFPLHLLELAGTYGVTTFINTDTVLPPQVNAYALSKSQFLDWGIRAAKANGIHFLNIKVHNMYGPGDSTNKLPTFLVQQCLQNASEISLTEGLQKRDFIYIDDVVEAYSTLLSHISGGQWFHGLLQNSPHPNGSRNIRNLHTAKSPQPNAAFSQLELGSGRSTSIREFAETIRQMTNSTTTLNFGSIPYRDYDLEEYVANIEPLEQLGWKPQWSLEQGLRELISSAR